jgi:hypothetical protein
VNVITASPRLTTTRAVIAVLFAVAADLLQFLLGALGWFGLDQLIDIAAMIFTTLAIGFHILLLPTFVLEFIPAANALPTWTACTLAVIALRWRRERNESAVSPPVQGTRPR